MAKSARRQISLFVDGNQVEATAKNISAAYKKASNELANMVVGSDAYISKLEEVQSLDGHLRQHREAIKGVEQGLGLAKTGLDKFIGITAGAFAVDSILDYGTALFGTASNLELMEKKARTVFGESLPQVTAEAEKNASAMGLTNKEYVAAAAGIQDLLVPMGFQREEAASMSTQLQNLSGALAEWSNGQHDSKEVSDILAKSLLGERDALNSLGIDIKQAEVDAELYARGLDKLTGAAAKQAEATVTLDLILQKSVDAQAAYADGSDSMARRSAELTAKFSEIRETLATALIPVFERLLALAGPVVDAFADLVEGISDMIDPAGAASEAFDEQARTVNNLEKDIVPLLGRYDELTAKSTLTKDEQEELRSIIDQVSNAVPTAVTEFDKYGRALSLNTDAARAFIAVEKERLKLQNESAIAENEKKLQSLKDEQKRLQDELNRGTKITTSGTGGGPLGGGISAQETSLSKEEIIRQQTRLRELEYLDDRGVRLGKIVAYEAEISRLRGDNLGKPIGDEKPSPDSTDSGTTNAEPGRTKEAEAAKEKAQKATEAAREKAQKAAEKAEEEEKEKQEKREQDLEQHLERVQSIIQQNTDASRLSSLSADEQEIERVQIKYRNEIEQVKAKFAEEQAVKEAVAQLELQRDAEIESIRMEQREAQIDAEVEADNEERQRRDEAKQQYEEEKLQAEEELKQFNSEALFSEQELEIQVLQDHYARLLQIAEQYGLDTTKLKEAYAKKQSEIEKKYADKTAKEQQESMKARLSALQSSFQAFGDFTTAMFDLLGTEAEDSSAVQKVATLAKIAFDTAQAISSLMAAAEANPTNAVTFGAAGAAQFIAGLARILSNVAQAKKLLSSAPKVKATQKAEGGFLPATASDSMDSFNALKSSKSTSSNTLQITGYSESTTSKKSAHQRRSSTRVEVTGADDGITYQAMQIIPPATGMLPNYPVVFNSQATKAPVLASERGAEYFVAAHDLSNPSIMHHVRMIENITRYGVVAQFAEGGFNTSATTAPAGTAPPVATTGVDIANLLAETTMALNNLAAAQAQLVALLSQGVTAVVPDRTITDIGKRFKVINEASGGYFS